MAKRINISEFLTVGRVGIALFVFVQLGLVAYCYFVNRRHRIDFEEEILPGFREEEEEAEGGGIKEVDVEADTMYGAEKENKKEQTVEAEINHKEESKREIRDVDKNDTVTTKKGKNPSGSNANDKRKVETAVDSKLNENRKLDNAGIEKNKSENKEVKEKKCKKKEINEIKAASS